MSHDHSGGKRPRDEFPDLEEAMDVWREDAERAAMRVDVHGALADRIVADVERRGPSAGVPTAARWYAAAAVLLIGAGIAGTLLARHRTPSEPPTIQRWATVETDLMDALASDPHFQPALGR